MRLIAVDGKEVFLNYMFLPTFIGLNKAIQQELEVKFSSMLVGKEATEDLLDETHEAILDFIEERFPDVDGLRDYLDAMKFVHPKKLT